MGAKILKNPWDSKQNPKKSHAEFRSLNNSQKALNDIIRKIKTLEIESVCVCLFIIPSEVVIRGTTTNLQVVLNSRQLKSQLKSSHPFLLILAKFSMEVAHPNYVK